MAAVGAHVRADLVHGDRPGVCLCVATDHGGVWGAARGGAGGFKDSGGVEGFCVRGFGKLGFWVQGFLGYRVSVLGFRLRVPGLVCRI
jgi:hypothetical protein